MKKLETAFAGLTLKNPFSVSSCNLTNSAEKNRRWEEAGAGAVVLKSLFEEEIEAEYSKIAEEGGITVEEVKKHYSDARSKEYLIDDAKERKLYDELYKEVKVTKGDKVSFAELFNKR